MSSDFRAKLGEEAAEHIGGALGSEGGEALRGLLIAKLGPEKASHLLGGFAKVVAHVVAVLGRVLIPDSAKWGKPLEEAISGFVDDFFGKVNKKEIAGSMTHDGASMNIGRHRPLPNEAMDAILGLSKEYVDKLADFYIKVLETSGEAELERLNAWLSDPLRTITELKTFALLSDEQRMAIWKAQKDPKEQKRLLEEAHEATKATLEFLISRYNQFDARCAAQIPEQEARIAALKKQLDAPPSKVDLILSMLNPLHW